jgi:hypothetical protein
MAENSDLKQCIVLTLTEGEPLVRVKIHSPNPLDETNDDSPGIAIDRSFTASFQAVSAFFSDDWCTGFMSVTEDGPVYIASSSGTVTVLVQRKERFEQTLRWYDEDIFSGLYVPNVLFKFSLTPKDTSKGFYRIDLSKIYLMDGAFLGEKTVLRSARRLCNVFDDHAVCWGKHDSANGGDVTIPSLTNMVGEFFRLPFNGDLHPNFDFWHRMKKDPGLARKEATVGIVADIIGN